MRIKYILVFVAVLVISIGSLWYYKGYVAAKKGFDDVQKTTVQLMPVPTLFRDAEGTIDNSLHNLLVTKVEHKIDLKHASIDIHKGIQTIPWFVLRDLHLVFEYDVKNSRVNFVGNNKELSLSGQYEITNKNNIRYIVHITRGDSQIDIDALYNPGDSEDASSGSVVGKFEFKSNLLSKALEYVKVSSAKSPEKDEYLITAKGSFDNKNDKIHFFGIDLAAKDLEVKLSIDVDDAGKVNINGNLEKFDMAAMLKNADFKKMFDSLLSVMVYKMPDSKIAAKFTGSNLSYNDSIIKEFTLESSSDPTNKAFKLNNLKICTNQDSCISTNGAFSRSNFRSQYKGEVIAKNLQSSVIASVFGLESEGVNTFTDIDVEIIASPGLLLLSDVKTKEGETLISTPFIKWSVNAESIINTELTIANYNNTKASILRSLFSKWDLSLLPDFSSIYSSRKDDIAKTIMDIKVDVNNYAYENGTLNNFSFRYLNYPDFISVQDIVAKSPDFLINGSFFLDMKNSKPNMDIKLSGEKVDMYKLHNLLLGNKAGEGFNLYLQKLKDMQGKISLNLLNPSTNVLQSISCSTSFSKDAIDLNGCKLGVFGGQMLISEGYLSLSDILKYDVKYSIQGMNLKSFTESGFYINTPLLLRGNVNIEATESSSGKDLVELLKNLNAKFKIKSVSDIVLDNFSIDTVIEKYIHKAPKKTKVSARAGSIFKELEGDISVKGGVLKVDKMYFKMDQNAHGQTDLAHNLLTRLTQGNLDLFGLYQGDKTRALKLAFEDSSNKMQFKLRK